MDIPEYSMEERCPQRGRTCRRCFLLALTDVGIDAERYLKDALNVYTTSYRDAYRRRYDTDLAYRLATRAKWKVYRANRRPQWMAWKKQRTHLRRASSGDFTKEQWVTMQALHQYRCAYCHSRPKVLAMDHVIPIAKGGRHTWENIVPACKSCNSRKGIKLAPTHQMVLKLS